MKSEMKNVYLDFCYLLLSYFFSELNNCIIKLNYVSHQDFIFISDNENKQYKTSLIKIF